MYLLILTLTLNYGYAGMGGISMREVPTLEECQSIGKQWVDSIQPIKQKDNRNTAATYVCVKIGGDRMLAQYPG